MKKIILSLFIIFSVNVFGQSWQALQIASLPEPVSNNAVCAASNGQDQYVYSFSGVDSTKQYSGIHLKSFRYSVNQNQWESLPDLPDDMGKIAAGATEINGVIYIVGGYHVLSSGNEVSSNKVHRFLVAANTFVNDAPEIPVPIDDHVQFSYQNRYLYVITGWSNNGNVDNVQIFDTEENIWLAGTSVPNDNQYQSFGASGQVMGNTIYYFGGAAYGANFPIQNELRVGTIDDNDPTIIDWEVVIIDETVGYRMGCEVFQESLVWVGGSNTTYNYDGIAYNGSGGVAPNRRLLFLEQDDQMTSWMKETIEALPMDLRGIGKISKSAFVVAGGMQDMQQVSSDVYLVSKSVSSSVIGTTNTLNCLCDYNQEMQELNCFNQSTNEVYTVSITNVAGQNIGSFIIDPNSERPITVADIPVQTFIVSVFNEQGRSSIIHIR